MLPDSKLFELISNQQLVLTYAISKLEILNYWADGYHNNKPVLINNRFLIYNSHIYYRSLIIDFCALYGSGKNDRVSFHKIPDFYSEMNEEAVEYIVSVLSKYNSDGSPISELKILRDKQIAHYDLEEIKTISFNHEYLELFNNLSEIGKQIITRVGKTFSPTIGFDFSTLSKLDSLEHLVNEVVESRKSRLDKLNL